MSAIDRRLDKLEEKHAPPDPPVKWRRVIADSQAEADQIIAEWDAAAAARASEGIREGLIIHVMVSPATAGSVVTKIEGNNNVSH